jgi:hypothetical protein
MAATIVGPIGASPGLAGGVSAANNLTSAQVIKALPGVCVRIICIAAGTLTLNDCATTGAAAATNEFFPAALACTAGQIFELDWPCSAGIVASVVTGTFSVAFS